MKKLFVFYRNNRNSSLDLRIVVLALLTFSRSYKLLFMLFLSYSFFNDCLYGFTLYFIIGCFTTIYLSHREVRKAVLDQYGQRAFRLLGWNILGFFARSISRQLVLAVTGTSALVGMSSYLYESPTLGQLSEDINQDLAKKNLERQVGLRRLLQSENDFQKDCHPVSWQRLPPFQPTPLPESQKVDLQKSYRGFVDGVVAVVTQPHKSVVELFKGVSAVVSTTPDAKERMLDLNVRSSEADLLAIKAEEEKLILKEKVLAADIKKEILNSLILDLDKLNQQLNNSDLNDEDREILEEKKKEAIFLISRCLVSSNKDITSLLIKDASTYVNEEELVNPQKGSSIKEITARPYKQEGDYNDYSISSDKETDSDTPSRGVGHSDSGSSPRTEDKILEASKKRWTALADHPMPTGPYVDDDKKD